jgi:Kdo2-lipid IVA lauroyltransferase/acyltransferase
VLQDSQQIAQRMRSASRLKRLLWRCEFAVYISAKWISQRLSLRRASCVGNALGKLWSSTLAGFFPIHKSLLNNLSTIFPDWSMEKRKKIAQASWAEWGRVMWEYPHLETLKAQPWRIQIKGQEVLDQLKKAAEQGQPTIIVSGHFSFFQAIPIAAARWGLHFTQMYRRQSNPMMSKDWEMLQLLAVPQIASRSVAGTKRVVKALSQGKSIFLLFDQHIRPGFELPFLGHRAMTVIGPAILAKRFNALLVFAYTKRLGPGEFEVTFSSPTPTHQEPQEIMARLNDQLGQAILKHPDHWMWCYRRWLFSRKKGYTSSRSQKP